MYLVISLTYYRYILKIISFDILDNNLNLFLTFGKDDLKIAYLGKDLLIMYFPRPNYVYSYLVPFFPPYTCLDWVSLACGKKKKIP